MATIRANLVLFVVTWLMLFNYGFMQIRLGSIPLAELVLIFFLITTNHSVVLGRFATIVNPFPFVAWWIFGLSSAFYYLYLNGIWALRDANNVIESLFILVGFSVFALERCRHFIVKKYPVFLFLLCVYALSYPVEPLLQSLSPKVIAGQGHSVPIFFKYSNSSMMLLLGALFLVVSPQKKYIFQKYGTFVAAFILLFAIGFFQARTLYLQIIALIIILAFVKPVAAKQWLYMLFGAFLLLLLVSVLGIEIEGRLGQKLSVEFLQNHFMAIFGVQSEGLVGAARGVGQRLGWWVGIYEEWSTDLITMLFGLGYGFPLIDFRIAHDIAVREPHNSYISVLARGGLIGFFLWAWLHWYLLKAWHFSYRACKRFNWCQGELMLIMILSYFVLNWCLAIGEDGFEKPYNAVPYYFLWGIVVRIAWFAKKNMIDCNGVTTK